MPRENTTAKKIRTMKLIAAFQLNLISERSHCEFKFSSPLQLLIATILSRAMHGPARVNIVTAGIVQKFRSAKDFG